MPKVYTCIEENCQMTFATRTVLKKHKKNAHVGDGGHRDGYKWLEGRWEDLLDELNQGPSISVTLPVNECEEVKEQSEMQGVNVEEEKGQWENESVSVGEEEVTLPPEAPVAERMNVEVQAHVQTESKHTQTNSMPVLAIPKFKPDTFLGNQSWLNRIHEIKKELREIEKQISANAELMTRTQTRSVSQARKVLSVE